MVADTHERVKRPVEAVIFDYGGVLRPDGREAWTAIDEQAGLPRGALWAAWHDLPEYQQSRQGAIDADVFRAAIVGALALGVGETRAEAALGALERHLASLTHVDPDLRALIERLRGAGRVKLGLLSNAGRGFAERLRARGVTALFDDVVVSSAVGLAKPDPAVFRLAAERLGVAPDACLMIDDQPQHLPGAVAAGLRTFHFTPGSLGDLVACLQREGALP